MAVEKYEIKITEEIKKSDNKGKMLWKNINKLRGFDTKIKIPEIYNEDKQKIKEKDEEKIISKYWKCIQNK